MSTFTISGTHILLWCWVRGSTSIFCVTIGKDNHVSVLKDVIREKKSNDFANVDADRLVLWKLKKPVDDKHISDIQNLTLQDDENVSFLRDMRRIRNYWPENQDPTEDLIHVIVEAPIPTAQKRTFDKAVLVDNSNTICNGLIQKFANVPKQVSELLPLINAPLLRKLPVTSDEEKIHPELSEFICTREEERRSTIAKNISEVLCSTIDREFLGNKSVSMLHHPLDSMIRIPLDTFNRFLGSALPIEIDRDSADSETTTIGTKRPDFLCWTKNLLLFKGEEKAYANNFDTATNELVNKFNILDPIFFGEIRFMICYTAVGSSVCFYAIDGSEGVEKQLTALTNPLDASNPLDRIAILCTVVNIARIILTISDNIPNTIIPLGKRQKLGHSFITFYVDSVEKRVLEVDLPYSENLNSRIQFLKSMYQHAKGFPGLVQIEKGPVFTKGVYKIVMKTRGIPCVLKTENELREMTRCVLTGLVRLHGGNFVHCDIRLPNILYTPGSPENSKYVLIDFEHGNRNKQKSCGLLKDWDENTLTTAGYYTFTSDLYQLGKLLEKYSGLMATADGNEFITRLKSKYMTAATALKHAWFNSSASTSM